MSEFVTGHPAYKRWKRELDQANAALDQYRKREAEAWQPYNAAMAKWERQAGDAARAGKPPPERPKEPQSPFPPDTLFMLTEQRQRVVADETKVLGSIASDVEAKALVRERELREIVAPNIGPIVEAAAEMRDLLSDVRRCRDARAPGTRPSPSERMFNIVDASMLIDMPPETSFFTVSPLEPRPPDPPDPPIITTTPPQRIPSRTGREI